MLVLDGQTGLLRATEVGVLLAVAAYPMLVSGLAWAFLRHGWPAGRASWTALPLVVARPIMVLSLVVLATQVPSDISANAPVYQDITPSVICAARDVLQGQDPYQTPELRCLRALDVPVALATPLRAGPFRDLATYPTVRQELAVEHTARARGYQTGAFPIFGYPPLSFVWMLPAALGHRGSWALWTLIWAAAWLGVAGKLAGRWRPAVVLILSLQWATGGALGDAAQGNSEFFAVALLALALLLLDSPRLSALALGLAAATSQIAWITLPGYLLLVRHLDNGRRRLWWLAGTVALTTLPWAVAYPAAPLAMWRLVVQPAYPLGIGLVALSSVSPLLPLLPKASYLAATAAAELVLLAVSLRSRESAALAVVLAPAALWFSWRSETSFLGLVLVLACAATVGLDRLEVADQRRHGRTLPTSVLSACQAADAAPRGDLRCS